jgi:glycerol transport system ATP-binding protein
MTVAENLAFPLRNRKLEKTLVDARVREVLAMLELSDLARRRARGLAADIQQKISLGRALVRTDVSALLFDEPLTVIDPALKWRLRAQIKLAHRDFSHTMIYVTHDQTEALTFAEKVVVMLEGEVLQVGTPRELFEAPAHTFVGTFIGSPGMNILPCTVNGNRASLGPHTITLDGNFPSLSADTELGIRPEHVELHEADQHSNGLPAKVLALEDLGRFALVRLELGGQILQALLPEGKPLPATPVVCLPPAHIGIYHHSRRLTGVPR